jgi:hypothetical protein
MEVFLQANFLTAAAESRKFSGARSKWEKKRSQVHVRPVVAADLVWLQITDSRQA